MRAVFVCFVKTRQVFLNLGNCSFQAVGDRSQTFDGFGVCVVVLKGCSTGISTQMSQLADFDNDGDLDMTVVVNTNNNDYNIVMFERNTVDRKNYINVRVLGMSAGVVVRLIYDNSKRQKMNWGFLNFFCRASGCSTDFAVATNASSASVFLQQGWTVHCHSRK